MSPNRLPPRRRPGELLSSLVDRVLARIWQVRLSWWRLQGARIAPTVRCYGRVSRVGPAARLTIGAWSTLNEGVHLNLHEQLVIRTGVRISAGAQIHTGALDFGADNSRRHRRAPVTIEDDAWIASGVIVSPGVTIGRGAVVAAGSVVTEDIEPDTLVAGAPARHVRTLTSPESGRKTP